MSAGSTTRYMWTAVAYKIDRANIYCLHIPHCLLHRPTLQELWFGTARELIEEK